MELLLNDSNISLGLPCVACEAGVEIDKHGVGLQRAMTSTPFMDRTVAHSNCWNPCSQTQPTNEFGPSGGFRDCNVSPLNQNKLYSLCANNSALFLSGQQKLDCEGPSVTNNNNYNTAIRSDSSDRRSHSPNKDFLPIQVVQNLTDTRTLSQPQNDPTKSQPKKDSKLLRQVKCLILY